MPEMLNESLGSEMLSEMNEAIALHDAGAWSFDLTRLSLKTVKDSAFEAVALNEGHDACLVQASIDTVLTKDGAMMIGARELVRTGYPDVVKNVPTGLLVEMAKGLASIQIPTRRREMRIVEQKICEYELCESIDEEAVVIQQAEAYSLNRSRHGILLLMGCSPRIEQLLELRIPESRWRRSLNLYEVQWTQPVRVESCGPLFLVGCRLVFGPSRYWAF